MTDTIRIPRLKMGSYTLTGFLGSGAFGEVFEARHDVLATRVAVKIQRRQMSSEKEWEPIKRKFRREAAVASRIQSRYIVRVIDYGEVTEENILREDSGAYPQWEVQEYLGALYMVMEYVEGRTLRDWIMDHPDGMPLHIVDEFVQQIASGLDEIHRAGAVHRDIKPTNIMVVEESGALGTSYVIKILDFGMVKTMDVDATVSTHGFKGTPMYAAKEQLYDRNIGPHTDVYALAVMTYEMLSGHPPFVLPLSDDEHETTERVLTDSSGRPRFRLPSTMKLLNMKINDEFVPLQKAKPGLSPRIYRTVARGMSSSISDRYRQASEFAREFHDAVEASETLWERLTWWAHAHPKAVKITGAALLLILSLVGGGLYWHLTHSYERVIVILTRHSAPVREEFGRAFTRWMLSHHGQHVKVVWKTVSGTQAMVEAVRRTAARKGGADYDVIFGGGEAPYIALSRKDCTTSWLTRRKVSCLAEYRPSYTPEIFGTKFYDPGFHWFGAAISTFGIFCNTRELDRRKLSVPATWHDLMKPAFRGLVVLGDPAKSGVFHTILEILLQMDGWDRGWRSWAMLLANGKLVSGSREAVEDVVMGRCACTLTIDFYAFEWMKKSRSRYRFVVPAGQTIVNSDPIAVVRGARHPHTARRFVEFVLSREGQALWWYPVGAKGGPKLHTLARLPVRPDVYFTGRDRAVDFDPTSIRAMSFDTQKTSVRWRVVDVVAGVVAGFARDFRKLGPRNVDLKFSLPLSEHDAMEIAGRLSELTPEKTDDTLKALADRMRAAIRMKLASDAR